MATTGFDEDGDGDEPQVADPRSVDEQNGGADFASDEVRMDMQPVLKLALWAYQHHAPNDQGRCPVCGREACDPYRWADEILTKLAAVPLFVIRRHRS